ncbi:hypothetical protein LPW11_11140 [Geomonas sp. RF6]|uniref:hypothetical protein n=1 Tax=Geomonas sp. RF6 TaxID=2897342 RepID=UPI001E374F7B|nr:hypothetical protein [Geomonas sp. RF6]UFS72728.1 hypothetical protein LPW11_11140 [Geomonas sp. RF6]
MGYRCRDAKEMAGNSAFRCVEVVLVKKAGVTELEAPAEVLVVDNHWDTLRYVQENMDQFVSNMVRMKKLDAAKISEADANIDASARLFEKNLGPLFVLISAMAKTHVMDKLSGSLKKALLLMAMERYNCDMESICRALGLTRMKLDRELSRCGLLQFEPESAAAVE